MIRRGTRDDIPALAGNAMVFSGIEGRDDLPTSTDEYVEALVRLFDVPGFVCLIVETDGQGWGTWAGVFAPMIFRPSQTKCEVAWLQMRPGAPAFALPTLLKAVRAEMRLRGAVKQTWYELPQSPKSLHLMYKRMGLVIDQVAYSGAV